MIEPRLELKPGSAVIASDGSCGYLQQIFLDVQKLLVVALVVRTDLSLTHPVVIPMTQVIDATDRDVWLRITRSEVGALPKFYPRRYARFTTTNPEPGLDRLSPAVYGDTAGSTRAAIPPNVQQCQSQPGVLARYALVRADTPVMCSDRRAGRVFLLLLTPQGYMRHLVIRRWSGLSVRDVPVPVEWIQTITNRGVHLAVAARALKNLRDYQPDQAIAAEIDGILKSNDVLHAIDYHRIDATVSEGIVVLNGYVTSHTSKRLAERAVRAVRGVRAVENRLIVDDELVHAVAQALAQDVRTRDQRVCVYAQGGIIHLSGHVSSAAVRAAVEAYAAGVPLVRGIVNNLQVPGVTVPPDDWRVLQPRIGQEVYAGALLLGHVEWVVINPCTRRVTAFVMRGQVPDREYPHTDVLDDTPPPERHFVIPIQAVRDVTVGGVLLHASDCDAMPFDAFTPAGFVVPDESWQPPYPYRSAEVLFEQQYARIFRSHPVQLRRSSNHYDAQASREEVILIAQRADR